MATPSGLRLASHWFRQHRDDTVEDGCQSQGPACDFDTSRTQSLTFSQVTDSTDQRFADFLNDASS
jgi:hypothetical protein